MSFLKKLRGALTLKARRFRPVRKILTRNYGTGKIAFGEQHKYHFPYFWITIDMEDADFNVDIRKQSLHFPDNSQTIVYSSHVIEHLDQETLVCFLKEARRILKPGSHIRLEAPDTEKMIRAYKTGDKNFLNPIIQDIERDFVKARGYPKKYAEDHVALLAILSCYIEDNKQTPVYASREEVNDKLNSLNIDQFGIWCVSLQSSEQRLSGGHINVMYFDKLKKTLEEAGFRNVIRTDYGQTTIKDLRLKRLERANRAFYSLYVEAQK